MVEGEKQEGLRLPARMELRDWAAGQILKALIHRHTGTISAMDSKAMAFRAFASADDFLVAREKSRKTV
jgi:hypothetical protein